MKVTCENCNNEIEVAVPVRATSAGKSGSLTGLTLDTMTLEQLKQEKRNAKSVLYKSEKAGRPEEALIPKRIRVAAVEARIAELQPVHVVAVPAEEVVTPAEEA